MTKEKEQDVRLFDKRTLERTIKRGSITPKDVEKYLKSLPDAASKLNPNPPEDTDED
jgi:hypothetical protein